MAAPTPILPTVCASALLGHVPGKGMRPLRLEDVPGFASEFLEFRGLNVPVELLRGLSEHQLKHVAHRADQAGCPFLALVDDALMPFHGGSIDASAVRLERLLLAAKAIGAASVGVRVPCEGDDAQVSRIARSVREVLEGLSRHEVLMLLRPSAPGLGSVERFTTFIQRIGGFRIGAMVSSETLEESDPLGSLRRLAPYAGCIQLTPPMKRGKPDRAALTEFVRTVQAVGYQHSICLQLEPGPAAAKHLDAARAILVEAIGTAEAVAAAPAEDEEAA